MKRILFILMILSLCLVSCSNGHNDSTNPKQDTEVSSSTDNEKTDTPTVTQTPTQTNDDSTDDDNNNNDDNNTTVDPPNPNGGDDDENNNENNNNNPNNGEPIITYPNEENTITDDKIIFVYDENTNTFTHSIKKYTREYTYPYSLTLHINDDISFITSGVSYIWFVGQYGFSEYKDSCFENQGQVITDRPYTNFESYNGTVWIKNDRITLSILNLTKENHDKYIVFIDRNKNGRITIIDTTDPETYNVYQYKEIPRTVDNEFKLDCSDTYIYNFVNAQQDPTYMVYTYINGERVGIFQRVISSFSLWTASYGTKDFPINVKRTVYENNPEDVAVAGKNTYCLMDFNLVDKQGEKVPSHIEVYFNETKDGLNFRITPTTCKYRVFYDSQYSQLYILPCYE